MKLLIGTSNPGKFREFAALLAIPQVHLCSLAEYPALSPALEEGRTFADNARHKAAHYSRLTGLPVVADDSGLEVDALDAQPGVCSARYAGARATDRDNIEKLLRQLESVARRVPPAGLPESGGRLLSAARFVCFLSFFARGKERFSAEGTCAGFITADPRGENGFGYDPVFWVPAFGRTVAELSAADKNQISHRGAAARQMREFLLRHPEVLR